VPWSVLISELIQTIPCLDSCFPAASIFKIVTAAGAIEKLGLNKDSQLVYNGGKYTLYKSQLNEQQNKYSHTVTFQKSFAESINPIFGKLGKFKLKKDFLISYADAFGFNHEIDFELPLKPSQIKVSDEPYNWAELASGFNRETSLSPLHAALITAALLNNGKIPEPVFVEQILSENGQKLYESRSGIVQTAVKGKTTEVIRQLMEATISSGTSRRAFQGYTKDQTLSNFRSVVKPALLIINPEMLELTGLLDLLKKLTVEKKLLFPLWLPTRNTSAFVPQHMPGWESHIILKITLLKRKKSRSKL
jgi:penicillin-binding protein A